MEKVHLINYLYQAMISFGNQKTYLAPTCLISAMVDTEKELLLLYLSTFLQLYFIKVF